MSEEIAPGPQTPCPWGGRVSSSPDCHSNGHHPPSCDSEILEPCSPTRAMWSVSISMWPWLAVTLKRFPLSLSLGAVVCV